MSKPDWDNPVEVWIIETYIGYLRDWLHPWIPVDSNRGYYNHKFKGKLRTLDEAIKEIVLIRKNRPTVNKMQLRNVLTRETISEDLFHE